MTEAKRLRAARPSVTRKLRLLLFFTRRIKRRLTFGASFKATVHPQILLWMAPHHRLDHRVNRGGIGNVIAAGKVLQRLFNLDMIDTLPVAVMLKRYHLRATHLSHARGRGNGCRLYAKKGRKHGVFNAVILIGGIPNTV